MPQNIAHDLFEPAHLALTRSGELGAEYEARRRMRCCDLCGQPEAVKVLDTGRPGFDDSAGLPDKGEEPAMKRPSPRPNPADRANVGVLGTQAIVLEAQRLANDWDDSPLRGQRRITGTT